MMAAEIEPVSVGAMARQGNVRKPQLIGKVDGGNDDINMAIIIPREDGVISVSDDKTLRVWLKRDSGHYWPSICHSLPSAAASIEYSSQTRRIFVGLDNGLITEFELAEDYNSMNLVRNYLAHQSRVTAMLFCLDQEWLLSCGRDKYFQWHCSETGRRLAGYQTNAWCTSLQYDTRSKYVFVGDYSGQIAVLKLITNTFEEITTLRGHTGSVRCLAWDEERSLLFSGSFDQSIIVWDIGGQQGTAFELQGHHDKVQTMIYCAVSKQLLSSGDDCMLVLWNMDIKRQETPQWVESDACQKCESPFFWNVKAMWQMKTIGVRQHHCRKCGKAVCAKCSKSKSTLPILGFEYDVRVCDDCLETITDDDRAPMATFHDVKQSVVCMDLDVTKKVLLTVGKDSIMKLWDVTSVLH